MGVRVLGHLYYVSKFTPVDLIRALDSMLPVPVLSCWKPSQKSCAVTALRHTCKVSLGLRVL